MQGSDRTGHERAGQLADVVRGLVSRQHAVVLVSGPTGFGTSTFLDNVAAGCRSAGWRVVTASGSSVHRTMPYAMIIDLLRDLVGTTSASAKLTEGIPDLQWLIGSRPAANPLPTEPGLERARLADAVRQVLQRAAASGRLLVVIDDVQDADDVSLEILRYAVTDRQDDRVGCVVGLRLDPGTPAPVGVNDLVGSIIRSSAGTRVAQEPLTRAEVAAQLTGILGDPPPDSVITLAHGLSGGSPGLVGLLVAELRRRGVLERRAGMWLLGPVDDLTVPADAEPMLASMLAGVDEAARCAFQLLSAADGELPTAVRPPFTLCTSTWVPTGTGLSVQGNVLTVSAAGTFSIALTSGTVRSNSLAGKATLVTRQLRLNTTGGQVLAPQTYADGTVVNVGKVHPKRSGYTFTGWFTDPSLKRSVSKLAITADTTLYAGWR